jgi:hypothetical protein
MEGRHRPVRARDCAQAQALPIVGYPDEVEITGVGTFGDGRAQRLVSRQNCDLVMR